ncbi:MAG TPA: hypothetical protein VGJ26_11325 [Pirellulales bacterium]
MSLRACLFAAGLLTAAMIATSSAANLTEGMAKGTPEIKSVGPATFAPQGILLLGDTQGATIYAIATGDAALGAAKAPLNVEQLDEKIAALLGTSKGEIVIHDLAVNPETGNAFLTVSRGRGPEAKPVIVRVDASGSVGEFPLKDVLFSKAAIPNAPENNKDRLDVTTDLQFAGGQVIVAGLSNEEFASKLRTIPFPFGAVGNGASVEIYHGAHGKFETRSPIRTLALFSIGGEPNVLAAYTCTPLVKFPVSDLKSGAKIKGTTVAELGNHNRPLDMVVYNKDGKDYLLMANSARGVMKVDLANVATADGITEKIANTAGLPYETIKDVKGVEQLDRLNKENAVVLVKNEGGAYSLKAIPLP